MIQERIEAPHVELSADNGSTVKLTGLRGKPVVLCVYPNDHSLTRFDRMSS